MDGIVRKLINYRWSRKDGITWLIFVSFFHVVGCFAFYMPVVKINNFQPVSAIVLKKKIQTKSNYDGSYYIPKVSYRYTFQDQTYINDRVFPMDAKEFSYWEAEEIIRPYDTNQKKTVYVNPDKPEESFLIQQYDFGSIIWLGIITLAGLFGLNSVLRPREFLSQPRNPKRLGGKSYKFFPAMSIKRRLASALIAFTYVGVFAGYPTFFYLTHLSMTYLTPKDYSPPFAIPDFIVFYIFIVLNTIIFLSFAGVLIHKLMLYIRTKDPDMRSDKIGFFFNNRVTFQFKQKLKAKSTIEILRVNLVCMKTDKRFIMGFRDNSDRVYDTELFRDEKLFIGNDFYFFENTIQCDVTFDIPDNYPPTSFNKTDKVPKHYWYIHYVLELKDYPDYSSYFPIKVLKPASMS